MPDVRFPDFSSACVPNNTKHTSLPTDKSACMWGDGPLNLRTSSNFCSQCMCTHVRHIFDPHLFTLASQYVLQCLIVQPYTRTNGPLTPFQRTQIQRLMKRSADLDILSTQCFPRLSLSQQRSTPIQLSTRATGPDAWHMLDPSSVRVVNFPDGHVVAPRSTPDAPARRAHHLHERTRAHARTDTRNTDDDGRRGPFCPAVGMSGVSRRHRRRLVLILV